MKTALLILFRILLMLSPTSVKIALLILLLLGATISANAQKFPNIQQVSLRAPADIKIDGKATEWGDTFQAYNSAIEIFYTICNDTENLYFIAHSKEPVVIQKIIYGGITLTLKSVAKKSPVAPVSITYPLAPYPYNAMSGSTLRTPGTLTDSAVLAFNKQISDHIKTIPVTGVKEIPDSSVSVYNDQGIKSAQLIDSKKNYTYELAMPLKYLQQMIDATGTFVYIIQVNGLDTKGKIVIGGSSTSNPQEAPVAHGTSFFYGLAHLL